MTRNLLIHGVDQLLLQQPGRLLQALPRRLLARARGFVSVTELGEVTAALSMECFPTKKKLNKSDLTTSSDLNVSETLTSLSIRVRPSSCWPSSLQGRVS